MTQILEINDDFAVLRSNYKPISELKDPVFENDLGVLTWMSRESFNLSISDWYAEMQRVYGSCRFTVPHV